MSSHSFHKNLKKLNALKGTEACQNPCFPWSQVASELFASMSLGEFLAPMRDPVDALTIGC